MIPDSSYINTASQQVIPQVKSNHCFFSNSRWKLDAELKKLFSVEKKTKWNFSIWKRSLFFISWIYPCDTHFAFPSQTLESGAESALEMCIVSILEKKNKRAQLDNR